MLDSLIRTNKHTDLPIKVLVYPLTPDNPYQSLLYGALVSNGLAEVKTVNMPRTLAGFLFQIFTISYHLIISRARGFRLIHIHWLYQLGFPGKPIWPWMSHAISTLQICIFLFLTKTLGYKIVWTVHDIVPHHKLTLNDIKLTEMLMHRASKLIALSSATLEEIESNQLAYSEDKMVIIPHGNYIGSYPNTISKFSSRKKLLIPKDSFVYLFFGTILPYKNLLGMLEAFKKILSKYPNSVMLVAGKVAVPELNGQLQEAKLLLKDKLQLHLEFIPDEDVQIYYNAANIVVFPYLKITNSGVALLSASFAKPIIAPLIGAFKDIPSVSGIFYTAGDQQALENSMLDARIHNNNLDKMSLASLNYAESLSWNAISLQTYDLYRSISWH